MCANLRTASTLARRVSGSPPELPSFVIPGLTGNLVSDHGNLS